MFKKILVLGLLSISFLLVKAQAPGCPGVSISAPGGVTSQITIPCDSCVTLSSGVFVTGETTSYTVSSIPYNPPWPFNVGTPIFVGADDVWSQVINLPFKFCFYGNIYDKLVVGANGLISFNLSYAGGFCPWAFSASIPSPSLPLNSIFGPYHDIDPGVGGVIRWGILGTYPCRTFVVNYHQVPMYSSSCNSMLATHQIVLYESTNVIEVHMQNKPTCSSWNSGRAALGIQNATGTLGLAAPGRNTGMWTTTNESWRFTPSGPVNFIVSWFRGTNHIGTGNSITVCPSTQTTYFARATYFMCDFTQPPVNVVDSFVISNGTIDVISNVTSPSICYGDSTLLSVTATGNSPITLQWLPATGLATTNLSSTMASPASNTTYSVIATSSLNCKDTVQIPLTVHSLPPTNITASNNPVCFEQEFTLTASGASTYLWNTNQTTEQLTLSLNNSQQYWVIGTDTNSCSDTAFIDMTVHPEVNVEISASSLIICSGDTVDLNASGAETYLWNTSETTSQIFVAPLTTSEFSVIGTSYSLCSDTANITINVYDSPTIDFSTQPSNKGCSPLSVRFTPNIIGDSILAYNWSFGAGGSFGTSNNINPQRTFATPGLYDVQLAVTTIHGCKDTLLKPDYLEVWENPTADYSFFPETVEMKDQGMQFFDLSTLATSWLWDFGDGNTSTDQNPVHFFDAWGRLRVNLTVTSDKGCENSHWKWINVIRNLTFYMPNAFFPGSGGTNQLFGPVGVGIQDIDLKIFDRWGRMVFFSNNINNKWDGTIDGQIPNMSSTYHWKAIVTFIDGSKEEFYGHVNLIR